MGIHIYKSYDKIFYTDDFLEELSELKKQDPNYPKWLDRKLNILDLGAKQATDGVNFEKLKLNDNDLYSIRRPKSKFNQRITYHILEESNEVILLSAFRESNDFDYKRAITRSLNRLKELRRNYYDI